MPALTADPCACRDPSRPDAPLVDTPSVDTPSVDAPSLEASSLEAPSLEARSLDAASTQAPSVVAAPVEAAPSSGTMPAPPLAERIAACRICAERFAATATVHAPRPVVWFRPGARLLIAGQAPGARVHASGVPFDDPSGDRLRAWLGLDRAAFYDRARVAIVPMAFCFPGYDAKGADLPPPKVCAETWHGALFAEAGAAPLRVLVGGYAQRWHLGAAAKGGVTATVADWRAHAPDVFPLPHPSWRNTGWLKRNPWFEAELLPVLRARVAEIMGGRDGA